MSIYYNSKELTKVLYNNTELSKIYFNNTLVFSRDAWFKITTGCVFKQTLYEESESATCGVDYYSGVQIDHTRVNITFSSYSRISKLYLTKITVAFYSYGYVRLSNGYTLYPSDDRTYTIKIGKYIPVGGDGVVMSKSYCALDWGTGGGLYHEDYITDNTNAYFKVNVVGYFQVTFDNGSTEDITCVLIPEERVDLAKGKNMKQDVVSTLSCAYTDRWGYNF